MMEVVVDASVWEDIKYYVGTFPYQEVSVLARDVEDGILDEKGETVTFIVNPADWYFFVGMLGREQHGHVVDLIRGIRSEEPMSWTEYSEKWVTPKEGEVISPPQMVTLDDNSSLEYHPPK